MNRGRIWGILYILGLVLFFSFIIVIDFVDNWSKIGNGYIFNLYNF